MFLWCGAVPTTSPSGSPLAAKAAQNSNSLSEALCWILSNTYKLPFLIHLLDDFLVVTPPLSPPASGLTALKSASANLSVPLSEDKSLFQASLPTEKLNRISLLISNFLLAPSCTRRQLLSLLGHLNFALSIIPQAFISHLLTIASYIPSLLSSISLNTASRAELCLWLHLLANLNGISLFYEDQLTLPHDISLFTNAAPSVGFGGFYNGRWFVGKQPPELVRECQVALSALFEIYLLSSCGATNGAANPSSSTQTISQSLTLSTKVAPTPHLSCLS